jgi:regulator of replication initiation timing
MRGKKENELTEVLKHYDKEMNELTDTMNQLNVEIDQDAEELTSVEKRVKALTSETAQFTMEKKNDELRLEHVAELEAKMHSSARIMQSFIRAFSVRQLAAQKGKKKKKKSS